MTDIKLTDDNDLDLTGLQLSLVSDGAAIAQEIRIACRFFLGEWKLDKRIGIDFLGRPRRGRQRKVEGADAQAPPHNQHALVHQPIPMAH
jgi:hypothetical protein